jgi:hypothetical protein
MPSAAAAVDRLDTSLFSFVLSQTSEAERRTLLAVQRAVASRHGEYVYLEIGSYLGGSLQPHVADHRCVRIFSVDPRPDFPPDDRTPGQGVLYEGNSKDRMLSNLEAIDSAGVEKITCFDDDAKDVPVWRITPAPHIAFIDGEHTHAAVLSDFRFCSRVIRGDGVILFHDFSVIHAAIHELCQTLEREKRRHVVTRLDGSIFGIFFDRSVIEGDPYLAVVAQKYGGFWRRYVMRRHLRRLLPESFVRAIGIVARAFGA